MTALLDKSSHNMAIHNGLTRSQPLKNQQFYSATTSYATNNNNGINNDHMPTIPYDQFVKSGYSEFEFWLRYCNAKKLTYTISHFTSMEFEQQGNILFMEEFHSINETLQYMHQCICKKMIWQPKCQAFGSNGQFLPIFLHYCSNWMAIMYQLLWYIKDIDLKPELIATLEKAALSKLNQLHTGRKSTYNVKNLNWHETSLMASPFI